MPIASTISLLNEQPDEIKAYIDSKNQTNNIDINALSKERGSLPMSPYIDPYIWDQDADVQFFPQVTISQRK